MWVVRVGRLGQREPSSRRRADPRLAKRRETLPTARAYARSSPSRTTLKGVDAQLDFIENDSGNIETAVRDARRANRYRKRGANFLRAAGHAFGINLGKLRGY
jgi:hypothetical protein